MGDGLPPVCPWSEETSPSMRVRVIIYSVGAKEMRVVVQDRAHEPVRIGRLFRAQSPMNNSGRCNCREKRVFIVGKAWHSKSRGPC